jgi:hypothetical protein
MFKRFMFLLLPIVLIITSITACKLPTADEMRQPDYAGANEADFSQTAIDEIGDIFDEIRDGTRTGPITYTITEAQLTAIIAQKIGAAPDSQISNVLINIEPDAMLMAADLVNDGETKKVVAEFTFVANGDTVAMVLGDFTYGGLLASIVPAAKIKFEEQINSGLKTAMNDPEAVISAIPVPDGATIDSIVMILGQITVTGTATAEVLAE